MKVIIIIFLVLLAILSVGALIRYSDSQREQEDMNIILISIDTLRADHMGVYGYSKNTTPHIDTWAKDAFVFSNMHTSIPATFPSFATLMTGKNPFETKIYNNIGTFNEEILQGGQDIPATLPTLAELLKKQKYTTAAFVSNYALHPSFNNISKGFSEYYFFENDTLGINDKKEYTEFFDNSLDWVEQNKKKKFFLWVHLNAPHAPYAPHISTACELGKEFCKNIQQKGLEKLEQERKSREDCRTKDLDKKTVELFQTLYDAEIAFDDKIVGKILTQIKNSGLENNTLVVFYGDHGEGFDHRYYFLHSDVLYSSSTRIPFIIKYPNTSGRLISNFYDNSEIFPTILDFLGFQLKNDTRSFNPLKTTAAIDKENTKHMILVNTNLTKYAIQDAQYKYIYSMKGYTCLYNNAVNELYDLKNDPNETKNIFSSQRNIAKKYEKLLLEELSQYSLPRIPSPTVPIESSEEEERIINNLKSLGY